MSSVRKPVECGAADIALYVRRLAPLTLHTSCGCYTYRPHQLGLKCNPGPAAARAESRGGRGDAVAVAAAAVAYGIRRIGYTNNNNIQHASVPRLIIFVASV